MLTNYFKIAWRNLIKNPFYSFVNIAGLATGIAFTLIIGTYVWSEKRINHTLKNADRQYIIQSKWKDPNQGIALTTMGPLAKALKEQYPKLVANYYRWDGVTSSVSLGDKVFREGLQICDSTMFLMYGFKLIQGDPVTALDGPFSLVITDEKANKYFGKTDVVGKSLTIENFSGSKHDFMITGVMKKPVRNSVTWITDDNDNQFYINAANISYFGRAMENWQNQYTPGYLELQDGVQASDLQKPMEQLIKLYALPQVSENMTPYLVPLNDYYLSTNNGLIKKMLYALSTIAFFILMMAVINFINLSVSRSSTRMREVGIRKVLGGLRKQLVTQFLTESILLTAGATMLAFVISSMTRPMFSSILGKQIPSVLTFPVSFLMIPFLLVIVVGILSGIYPALILSAMKSVDSVKGKLSNVGDKVIFRKSLVAFQFIIAAIAFIGALIISQQVKYFFDKNPGFNKEFIVSAQLPRDWSPQGVIHMEDVRKQFVRFPEIKNVTLSYEVMGGNSSGSISLFRNDRDSTTAVSSSLMTTDEYFAATLDIPMAAGDFFAKPGSYIDSTKIVINETQMNALGYKNPDDAVGKLVRGIGGGPLIIAGVIKDFNFGSVGKAIQPITFMQVTLNPIYRFFSFKLNSGDIATTMATLQKHWSAVLPGAPFEYTFLDDKLTQLYSNEIQLKKAAFAATVLSLIIVFLGVLGLIGLSVQRRVKEIGIRKILGSSVFGIIILFIKEFLLIVVISGVVACPIGYLLMNHWLKSYVYRIPLTAVPFVLAISVLGLLTAALICLQTLNIARTNPIKSLRT
ncbi:MAG: ABC transporter permease, partial [Saprospiraceae bacterium]